jgi:hypothetical protein
MPEDKIEKQFEFEAQQDRTVGLIGLIGFIVISSVVLLAGGMPFGLVATGAIILGGGAIGYTSWHRQKRRADAHKRRADDLMVKQVQREEKAYAPYGFIDPPSPFAPTAAWENFLKDLEGAPQHNHPDIQREIQSAKAELARRKMPSRRPSD